MPFSFDEIISIDEVAEVGISDYPMIEEEADLYEECEEEIMASAGDDELDIMADEDDIEDMGNDAPIDPDDEDIDSFIAKADFVDEEDAESFDLMDETPASEADIVDEYIDNEMEVE